MNRALRLYLNAKKSEDGYVRILEKHSRTITEQRLAIAALESKNARLKIKVKKLKTEIAAIIGKLTEALEATNAQVAR